jgi:hypothetical protein
MENTTRVLAVSVMSDSDLVVDFESSRFAAVVELIGTTVRGKVLEIIRFHIGVCGDGKFSIVADVLDPIDRLAYGSFHYATSDDRAVLSESDLIKIANAFGYMRSVDMISTYLVGVIVDNRVDFDWNIHFDSLYVTKGFGDLDTRCDVPSDEELDAMHHDAVVRDCAENLYYTGKVNLATWKHNTACRDLVYAKLFDYGIWALSIDQVKAKNDLCDEIIDAVNDVAFDAACEDCLPDPDFEEWLEDLCLGDEDID